MPVCVQCGESFPNRVTATDGSVRYLYRRRYCLNCHPFRPVENKGTGQAVIAWRQRLKLKAIAYKGDCCLVCGYNRCVRAFKFHHLDPAKKDFAISGVTHSWEKVRAELDKCVLLCGNCHDEVHAGMLDLTQALSRDPTPEEGYQKLIASGSISIKPDLHCPCGSPVTKAGLLCKVCANRKQEKIQWPPSEELLQMVQTEPVLAVARRLGVSDNAIRKRLRSHPPT